MTEVEYNKKKIELKKIKQELFDIRLRLELSKKDERKYNIWRKALLDEKKKMAVIKREIKEYEVEKTK